MTLKFFLKLSNHNISKNIFEDETKRPLELRVIAIFITIPTHYDLYNNSSNWNYADKPINGTEKKVQKHLVYGKTSISNRCRHFNNLIICVNWKN